MPCPGNPNTDHGPRFPPPKIFTNALLSNPDITSLIRDTEAHERALFSVPPPPPPTTAAPVSASPSAAPAPSKRRQTVFSVAAGEVTTSAPPAAARRPTAVAAVLGGDLHATLNPARRPGPTTDVDVETLLRGAEKLCTVYALPGAAGRIAAQRARHAQLGNTLAYYEGRVAEQAARLEGMNREWLADDDAGVGAGGRRSDDEEEEAGRGGEAGMTEEELRREEEEVRELERRKRDLQAQLSAMDKDIGALRNM